LKSLKSSSHEEDPKSLGEHLKRRRLELGLRQKETAARLGVTEWGYANWEKGKGTPSTVRYKGVVEFLGHYPHPNGWSLGNRLLKIRRCLGMTSRDAARLIGVDQDTLLKWERGEWRPTRRTRLKLERFLAAHEPNRAVELTGGQLNSKARIASAR
jgi:transcriptional regulator with XRE-family HTH domain